MPIIKSFLSLFMAASLSAATVTVSSLTDLQAAINSASPGDELVLTNGGLLGLLGDQRHAPGNRRPAHSHPRQKHRWHSNRNKRRRYPPFDSDSAGCERPGYCGIASMIAAENAYWLAPTLFSDCQDTARGANVQSSIRDGGC